MVFSDKTDSLSYITDSFPVPKENYYGNNTAFVPKE